MIYERSCEVTFFGENIMLRSVCGTYYIIVGCRWRKNVILCMRVWSGRGVNGRQKEVNGKKAEGNCSEGRQGSFVGGEGCRETTVGRRSIYCVARPSADPGVTSRLTRCCSRSGYIFSGFKMQYFTTVRTCRATENTRTTRKTHARPPLKTDRRLWTDPSRRCVATSVTSEYIHLDKLSRCTVSLVYCELYQFKKHLTSCICICICYCVCFFNFRKCSPKTNQS